MEFESFLCLHSSVLHVGLIQHFTNGLVRRFGAGLLAGHFRRKCLKTSHLSVRPGDFDVRRGYFRPRPGRFSVGPGGLEAQPASFDVRPGGFGDVSAEVGAAGVLTSGVTAA